MAATEAELENSELRQDTDVHFRFALGKAHEDLKDYDKAWHYYHSGNELKRQLVEYDPVANHDRHEAVRRYFTPELLSEAEGNGYPDEGPIFIVGLGRSGSTLVEQILASHSQVEGTEELAVLGKLSDTIGRYRQDDAHYPEALDHLGPQHWRSLGLKYLNEAKRYRMTDKPIFTDKFPNNYPFVGFLHLILPNAKIINARRHPLDSCLGNYKQLFGRGQNFTYDMLDLSEYYREYAQMMDHWNKVLPGKVLDDLLETVFTVQNYVILGLAILSLATVAVVTLVFLLSQQLRIGEFRTLLRIGASRSYVWMLVISEIGFVFIISAMLAAVLTIVTRYYAMKILQTILTL